MAFQEKQTIEEIRPIQTTSSVGPDNQEHWYYCSHTYTNEMGTDNNKEASNYKYNRDKKT